MRRTVILLLLSVYLLTVTQWAELVKIPILLEHYTEHRQLDQSMSFLEFLCQHYTNVDTSDADHHRDLQLPFKSSGISVFSGIYTYTLVSVYRLKPYLHVGLKGQSPNTNCFTYSSGFLATIFQPPKQM